jgi:hypothetical protein
MFQNTVLKNSVVRWFQAISAVALAGLAVIPVSVIARGPSLCLYKRIFGVECLGCGMTRAVDALLHADWNAAMHWNRGSPLALAVLLFLTLSALFTPDAPPNAQ